MGVSPVREIKDTLANYCVISRGGHGLGGGVCCAKRKYINRVIIDERTNKWQTHESK